MSPASRIVLHKINDIPNFWKVVDYPLNNP